MQHVTGTDRSQIFLLANCLDDIISEDNPARLIVPNPIGIVKALYHESHKYFKEVPTDKGAAQFVHAGRKLPHIEAKRDEKQPERADIWENQPVAPQGAA